MSEQAAAKPIITEVGFERAHEMIQEFTEVVKHEMPQSTVYTGEHPTLGQIHLVVPPLGNPFVLPVVIQNLSR